MKFVSDTTQGLEQAAAQLVKAIDMASEATLQATSSLPALFSQRLAELKAALTQLGAELSSLPAQLDPQPVVDSLTQGATEVRGLMAGFMDEVERLPAAVADLDGQMRPFIEESQSRLKSHASQLADWRQMGGASASARPQASDSGFKEAVQSWWGEAAKAQAVVDGFVSGAAAATDVAALSVCRQEALDALQKIRQQVMQSCADYRQGHSSAASEGSASPGDPAETRTPAPPAPTPVISLAPLDQALSRARQQIPNVAAQMGKPLAQARERVQDLQSRLETTAEQARMALNQALAPLRDIPQRLSQLVMDLASALSAFESALLAVKEVINDLIERAKDLQVKLGRFPELFVPVKSAIESALQQIRAVGARITPFVQQALGALTVAAGELRQADVLCDNAIAVCTRYMTRAPLLIPARALFVTIKAAIPTAQAAIATAKGSVGQVQSTAQAGIDQACAAVGALHPSVEAAVSQIQAAAARLAGLVKTLEGTMVQGVQKVDATGDGIEAQFTQASKQVDASAAKVAALPDSLLKQVPLDSTLETVRSRIKALTDRGFAQAEGVVGQAEERMGALLATFEQQIREKWAQAETSLRDAASQVQLAGSRFEAASAAMGSQGGSSPSASPQPTESAMAIDRERARLEQVFEAILQRLNAVELQVQARITRAAPSPGAAHG